MRAETTEAAHVEQQLRLHALAAPGVRFRFRKDERVIFDLPGVARTVDRVRQLIGNEMGAELVEIPERLGPGIGVMGFILPAKHARKGRRHQYVFLNGRPIEDAAISKGLAEGFRGNLQEGLHPAAWLWLDVEPRLVDVNVHPAKKEVRFDRPYELRDLISQAVAECLRPRPAENAGSKIAASSPASHEEACEAVGMTVPEKGLAFLPFHPASVIANPYQTDAALLDIHHHFLRPGIEAVLHQLLDHTRRTLHHLASRDLAG